MAAARAPVERPAMAPAFLDLTELGAELAAVALFVELEAPVTAAAADLDSLLASLDDDLDSFASDFFSAFDSFDASLLADLSVARLSLLIVADVSSRFAKYGRRLLTKLFSDLRMFLISFIEFCRTPSFTGVRALTMAKEAAMASKGFIFRGN